MNMRKVALATGLLVFAKTVTAPEFLSTLGAATRRSTMPGAAPGAGVSVWLAVGLAVLVKGVPTLGLAVTVAVAWLCVGVALGVAKVTETVGVGLSVPTGAASVSVALGSIVMVSVLVPGEPGLVVDGVAVRLGVAEGLRPAVLLGVALGVKVGLTVTEPLGVAVLLLVLTTVAKLGVALGVASTPVAV